jgi:hypothetical protein
MLGAIYRCIEERSFALLTLSHGPENYGSVQLRSRITPRIFWIIACVEAASLTWG